MFLDALQVLTQDRAQTARFCSQQHVCVRVVEDRLHTLTSDHIGPGDVIILTKTSQETSGRKAPVACTRLVFVH